MKQLFIYGISLALLLILLQTVGYKYLILTHSFEIYGGILAILFTIIGIWAGTKLTKPKVEIIEREVVVDRKPFELNQLQLEASQISQREYEVLELIAKGLSNQEIADQLYLSPNTIKTHSAKLFEKLAVNKRMQAVEKAREMGLIS
jgi:DNA-binding CsgD family transcriptional regulator